MPRPEIVSWFDRHWLDAFTRGRRHGFDSLPRRDRVLALVWAGGRILCEGPALLDGSVTRACADRHVAGKWPSASRPARRRGLRSGR